MHRTHQAKSGKSAPSAARDAWLCASGCAVGPAVAPCYNRAGDSGIVADSRRGRGMFLRRFAALFVSLLCVSLPLHAVNPDYQTPEETSAPAEPTAAQPLLDNLPAFLFQGFYASNHGDVLTVYSAEAADIVLLRGGFDSGFRNGMICQVRDGEEEVAEIVLVDVRHNCAAALITHLEDGRTIEPGHLVRIKTVR